MINPKITILDKSHTFNSYEGCLSVPNIRGKVKRYNNIKVEYFDRNGMPHKKIIAGLSSIVFQHEIDHLNGYIVRKGREFGIDCSTNEDLCLRIKQLAKATI